MTRSEISDMIARFQDSWNRRDLGAVVDFHSEDCVVDSPVAGGEARGREAIARSYEAFFHAFPDLTIKYDAPLIDGHRVVLITRISGTDHGGFMGLQPTGRFVDFSIAGASVASIRKTISAPPVRPRRTRSPCASVRSVICSPLTNVP